MIETIYTFFYEWLFSSAVPAWLSAQGVEFICLVFTVTVLLGVVSIALIPLKKIIGWIMGA